MQHSNDQEEVEKHDKEEKMLPSSSSTTSNLPPTSPVKKMKIQTMVDILSCFFYREKKFSKKKTKTRGKNKKNERTVEIVFPRTKVLRRCFL